MQLARIRIKKNPNKKITENTKSYWFICPVKVRVGQWVLIETKREGKMKYHIGNEQFSVGIVDELKTLTITQAYKMEIRPYSCVICSIPVSDFEQRCRNITEQKYKVYGAYEKIDAAIEEKKKKKQNG